MEKFAHEVLPPTPPDHGTIALRVVSKYFKHDQLESPSYDRFNTVDRLHAPLPGNSQNPRTNYTKDLKRQYTSIVFLYRMPTSNSQKMMILSLLRNSRTAHLS